MLVSPKLFIFLGPLTFTKSTLSKTREGTEMNEAPFEEILDKSHD